MQFRSTVVCVDVLVRLLVNEMLFLGGVSRPCSFFLNQLAHSLLS
uniref:Uncharacterized protein n=2 Tax=Anguilla anguilla TaxID=7936 RepID=A0A0E9S6I7_ANGAN